MPGTCNNRVPVFAARLHWTVSTGLWPPACSQQRSQVELSQEYRYNYSSYLFPETSVRLMLTYLYLGDCQFEVQDVNLSLKFKSAIYLAYNLNLSISSTNKVSQDLGTVVSSVLAWSGCVDVILNPCKCAHAAVTSACVLHCSVRIQKCA